MADVCRLCRRNNETGLSEVIGFILLIFLIIAAFSVYLVYSIPAQGRDNEIKHMDTVKDEFTGYKVAVDSLWTNNLTNSATSTSFQLGTQGQTTQGNTGILPMLQPVASGGTISITPGSEILTITADGMVTTGTVVNNQTLAPGSLPVNTTPSQLVVNISDSNPVFGDSVLVQGQNWWVKVNVSPVNMSIDGIHWNISTSVTIDVSKNGIMALQDYTVYSNIQKNVNYSVNLLDDAYGLKNFLDVQAYPAAITFTKIPATSSVSGYGIVTFPDEYEKVFTSQVSPGLLEYRANNNYWINQSYYYQEGGVFLRQPDGTTSILPPAITVSYDKAADMAVVNVIELAFVSPQGSVGGSSTAAVSTQVTGIDQLPFSQQYNNTKWVNISIGPTDVLTAQAWNQTLYFAANTTGGLPGTYFTAGSSGTGAFLYVTGNSHTATYPVHLSGQRVNLSASVQVG